MSKHDTGDTIFYKKIGPKNPLDFQPISRAEILTFVQWHFNSPAEAVTPETPRCVSVKISYWIHICRDTKGAYVENHLGKLFH
jgi:hypothetical protein